MRECEQRCALLDHATIHGAEHAAQPQPWARVARMRSFEVGPLIHACVPSRSILWPRAARRWIWNLGGWMVGLLETSGLSHHQQGIRWLSGSGGGPPGKEVTTLTPSAPSAHRRSDEVGPPRGSLRTARDRSGPLGTARDCSGLLGIARGCWGPRGLLAGDR
jgi:hypothetical protein